MIRFRLREDEALHSALLTELYLRVGKNVTDPVVVSQILRAYARLEAIAYGEGLRQGAIAAFSAVPRPIAAREGEPAEVSIGQGVPELADLSLLALVHRCYGESETPTSRAEPELGLPRLQTSAPMTFRVETLAEALRDGLFDEPPVSDVPAQRPAATASNELASAQRPAATTPSLDEDLERIEAMLRDEAPLDSESVDLSHSGHPYANAVAELEVDIDVAPREGAHARDRVQHPDLVARLRDTMIELLARGAIPKEASFGDLVVAVSNETRLPPSAVESALVTPIGANAVRAAGFLALEIPPPVESFASFVAG